VTDLQRTQTTSIIDKILADYMNRTQRTRRLWEAARERLPSGSSRTSIFYAPYPWYAQRAVGSKIVDVDENERIDYCYNFTSLILGHRHPAVMKAATDQMEMGTVFGAPTELELRHADMIKDRMPSLEKVRYTVTGTEACMFAIRLARAYTHRKKVAKFEGGYHGTSDLASVSVHPHLTDRANDDLAPLPETAGVSPGTLENTVILPFNNFEDTEAILRKNGQDLACVIVEPVMRGIPPAPGFLQSIRELTHNLDIVLIFDEVITGFRISAGGAQEKYGVRPDLTTMGKVIGGGFPVGAIGGREEIMSLMAHQDVEFLRYKAPTVPHAGTFNAHPITLAAGIATLKELTSESYAKLDQRGQELRRGFSNLMSDLRIKAQITGIGSFFDVYFTDKMIKDYRTSQAGDQLVRRCMDLGLLNRGVFLPSQHFACTSTATSREDVEVTLEAARESLRELLPMIRERTS